ncbi:T9SS type A sorting domain-containing protein [Hymenobacter sp. 5317J-9]|uniref:LamG-like jellyroll fold domain-containing protein n=1 Tax=Hymenobacter sp. 5317J-9 TaxID=2932250 RepID=UPI001FD6D762|nr:LamG-like jellyroll fold domain-containing protein [Hymenobacter sp. 5317J-9]UOQ96195.1 T9SS type A sorting domain-containing protein [Hymenobacter sp. 5317J-9]
MKQLYSFLRSSRRSALGLLLALGGGTLGAHAQTNSSLLFNGSTKYVQANTVTLNTSALSLEGWVKVTAFKTAFPYITSIMGIEDGNAAAMLRFGDATIPAGKLQFVLTVGTVQYKVTSNATCTANTWYHVAGTFDGTAMKLYINGALDNSTAVTGTAAATGVFYLGRNYEALRTLNGSLDELRVWTRALTAAEILANPCQVSPTATGLEAYWRLNEGTGLTTQDLTGKGHTGTLVGMAATDWSTNVPTQCLVPTATLAGATLPNGLQVQVLGNPVAGRQAEVEIDGAQGQPVVLTLCNLLGAEVWQQRLSGTRASVAVPAAAGLYVLRASTPNQTTSVKLVRQ